MSGSPFYRTSNSDYGNRPGSAVTTPESDGKKLSHALSPEKGKVPKISDILDARPRVKRPVTAPEVDVSPFVLQREYEKNFRSLLADPVLSADITPHKFPSKQTGMTYPPSARRDNPLYHTSSMKIGEKPPSDHQLADYYFPKGGEFTKSFTDKAPRYCGLETDVTKSKIHKKFDDLL
eukprot:gnl/MRDRNA2_/MRDRNA2_150411_c0_seq1.p1 gnl/MRDRNA2_/MRDRNA2_150411_c0~~gnl/MRDRNA2_/MRDRNA2_150411_c0_seq1.p1  ORF type:complete len:178 (+),score=32.96 gnl/MRDRNA2_/MRDRNA2_150411_c0_seq1:85-618(+)